ncbi:MAG: vitamin K epoxide reductase family protein [Pirellulales bacterium]
MMPPSMSHIPLPVGAIRRATTSTIQPAFGPLVRWTLVVLSWLAFSVAGYLAFHAVTGSSVAGCGLITSANGCDVVQSSSWSKWLGVPVAILGLGCYATLASLSILLGLRREPANRWITTAFVLLAVVAAGASTWFIGLQCSPSARTASSAL